MYKVVTNALSSQFVETNNLVCTWWFSWATHAASVFTIPAYISKVDTDTAELGYTRYGLTGCQKNKQTNKPTLCKHMMDIRQDNAATFTMFTRNLSANASITAYTLRFIFVLSLNMLIPGWSVGDTHT